MKTVLYSLTTTVGTFWIQPQPASRVLLGIDGRHLRTYASVRAAMVEVSARTTGFVEWDQQEEDRRPITPRMWTKGQRSPSGKKNRATAEE